MAKKRNNNNYFTREINNNGVLFLDKKNAKDLQLDAVKIFRDISRGRIDIREYSTYLIDLRLVEAAIIVAKSKYMLHNISALGVDRLRSTMTTPDTDIEVVYNFHYQASKAYYIILNSFMAVREYKVIDPIINLAGQLASFSDFI